MSKAAEILEAGAGHMKDRAQTYDSPEGERSMEKCVRMFNALTGHDMSAEQGWHFMTCLKMVRSQQGGYRADNYEDGAAYFALAGEQAEQDRLQACERHATAWHKGDECKYCAEEQAPPPTPSVEDPYGVCETPPESRWLCRNAVSELAERAHKEALATSGTTYISSEVMQELTRQKGYRHQCDGCGLLYTTSPHQELIDCASCKQVIRGRWHG